MTAIHPRIGRRRSISSAVRTGMDIKNKKPGPKGPGLQGSRSVLEGGSFLVPQLLLVRAGCSAQSDLRHAPVADLRRPDLVLCPALDLVDRVELLGKPSGVTELAEQFPCHIHLEDLAVVVDVFRRIRVR